MFRPHALVKQNYCVFFHYLWSTNIPGNRYIICYNISISIKSNTDQLFPSISVPPIKLELCHGILLHLFTLCDIKCSWWRHQMETFSALLAIWSPVNSPHRGQWRGALMFFLICVWINDWVNNHEAGDLRRYRAHYDVTLIVDASPLWYIAVSVWSRNMIAVINFWVSMQCVFVYSIISWNMTSRVS